MPGNSDFGRRTPGSHREPRRSCGELEFRIAVLSMGVDPWLDSSSGRDERRIRPVLDDSGTSRLAGLRSPGNSRRNTGPGGPVPNGRRRASSRSTGCDRNSHGDEPGSCRLDESDRTNRSRSRTYGPDATPLITRQVDIAMSGRASDDRARAGTRPERSAESPSISVRPDTTDQSWIGQDAILQAAPGVLAGGGPAGPAALAAADRPAGHRQDDAGHGRGAAAEAAALHQPVHGRHPARRT